ncbi:MAG: DUF1501 domain-containing protein [Planctomycetia bacterium]|nr:DUF1501 domain-containing protein [Planctomycetia bacterium]
MKRRNFLKTTAMGLAGLTWGSKTFAEETKPSPMKLGKAKSVIQIWMWGGPSHLETFDPKPEAGKDYCGAWDAPLETNVPGIRISQSLPQLATCADLYSIVRSVTHDTNHHEVAAYVMQTGRMPGGGLVYPNVGAVLSSMRGYDHGYDSPIPPYVCLTSGQGRFSESGFLGPRYKPFVTGGDPSRTPFLVSGYVVQGIDNTRQAERQEVLRAFDTWGNAMEGEQRVDDLLFARKNAYALMTGSAASTFDLSTETEETRNGYGMNWFGQSCLMARRLVQKGVPYITINYKGWDTHKRHFEILTRRQPEWDQGLSMLLRELRDLNLLDDTIVWWGGEFGRTPKIQTQSPWFGGRGHFCSCFSVLLAGGGFQGGKVVGASNETGERVAERPVRPQDLLGSIYWNMGIDPTQKMPNNKGFDLPIMESPTEAGWLREIMNG